MSVVERYHFLENAYNSRTNEAKQLDTQATRLREEAAQLKGWLDELKASICKDCDGHGLIRHFYAQDESRLETCTACRGSGLKSSVPQIDV